MSTSPGNVDQDHRTFSAQHVYQDNSHGVSPPTYTISVTVSDTSGGTSAPATFAVPVSNGAPSVSVVGDQTNVPEGSLLDLPNLATFTDPGVLDKHTYTIDWGDGSLVQTIAPASSTAGPTRCCRPGCMCPRCGPVRAGRSLRRFLVDNVGKVGNVIDITNVINVINVINEK